MNKEDRLELKKELSVYSKEELIEKYIDEIEETAILTNQWYKSAQKINKAIKYLEQPYRDNFDFSKAQLLEILEVNDE